MLRQANLYNKKITYELKKSKRAKRLRIAVFNNSQIVVTSPYNLTEIKIKQYVLNKSKWIGSKIKFFNNLRKKGKIDFKKNSFNQCKEKALELIGKKVNYFSHKHKFKYKSIVIKNQKTIWGSCSKKGNLNFNYKVALLPGVIRDYIIVHELCHLKIKNHSRKFWTLVESIMPSSQKIKERMIEYNLSLF